MSRHISPEQQLQLLMQPFQPALLLGQEHDERLQILGAGLPPLTEEGKAGAPDGVLAMLARREAWAGKALGDYYARHLRSLARSNLSAKHSFTVLHQHAGLVDALHRFALDISMEELPALVAVRIAHGERELQAKRALLPGRQSTLEQYARDLPEALGQQAKPAERDYYLKIQQTLAAEVKTCQDDIARLEKELPDLRAFSADPEAVQRSLVVFARGGYGRAELSFGSDLDSGYCLDTRTMGPGQIEMLKDLILRMETLLNRAGVATVHQYFEIDEDLSRFTLPETLHTISSVLEARALAGNAALLEELKGTFRSILPLEGYLKQKMDEFDALGHPTLTSMDLKEDAGGLRSIQVPLWIFGALHEQTRFMTVDLLVAARSRGLLSLHEVARLLQGLELLYELRNFVGAAERYYYDQEARDSECQVNDFPENRINDSLARLYLFRKRRFASVDAFDSQRLWLVSEVQALSQALLRRVLDRTHAHNLGPFWIAVHLGRKQITAIDTVQRDPVGALASRFPDGSSVLRLFEYIAHTDYDLTDELRDAMAEVVPRLPRARTAAERAAQAQRWANLMSAPYAHRALANLFGIRDPLEGEISTLMGRFIPEFNRVPFMLRNLQALGMPLHEHILRALAFSQKGLEALKESHPDLFHLLGPQHVLALKWSVFLHATCALEGSADDPPRSAELAAELLGRLGFKDTALESLVRLLIEHHRSVVTLCKTSSYMDQALAQYFEIAGRDIVQAVLLYLINMAVLQANGDRFEGDVLSLRRFFEEASRILAEMQGFPTRERSLELINVYFDHKKEDLEAQTRVHLLLVKSHALGIREALLQPLERISPREWERLRPHLEELTEVHKQIMLGNRQGWEQDRLVSKFIRLLRQYIGEPTVRALTRDESALFSWFFRSFPNRYLLGHLPWQLANQMAKFAQFRTAQVLVDVVPSVLGAPDGLLIYTRGLPLSHSRVAYALSRKQINIAQGKVNRVVYDNGEWGYCYYFQISLLAPEERPAAREMELLIAAEVPPALAQPAPASPYERTGVRLEFLGDDGKGYQIQQQGEEYVRVAMPYGRVRIVMRDQPYLFFKVSQVFDSFGAEVQQALITTTGNQVLDHFYLTQTEVERLRATPFEEFLINRVHTDLLRSVV